MGKRSRGKTEEEKGGGGNSDNTTKAEEEQKESKKYRRTEKQNKTRKQMLSFPQHYDFLLAGSDSYKHVLNFIFKYMIFKH